MKILRAALPAVPAILLALLAGAAHAADLYRWVDETGRVNYGTEVPEAYKKKAAKVETQVTVLPSAQMATVGLPAEAPVKTAPRKQPKAASTAASAP